MCGRFTLTKDTSDIAKRWRIGNIEVEAKPRYNIAPTQDVLIVTDDGTRELVQMRWGLIPSWADDPNVGNKMINARAETRQSGITKTRLSHVVRAGLKFDRSPA
jgi:putative SOS response-associated peptidase YedK